MERQQLIYSTEHHTHTEQEARKFRLQKHAVPVTNLENALRSSILYPLPPVPMLEPPLRHERLVGRDRHFTHWQISRVAPDTQAAYKPHV